MAISNKKMFRPRLFATRLFIPNVWRGQFTSYEAPGRRPAPGAAVYMRRPGAEDATLLRLPGGEDAVVMRRGAPASTTVLRRPNVDSDVLRRET